MQAVILAAGKGLRLRPFTEKHPKPLIEITPNKALIEFTLEALPNRITEVIVVVGYLSEQIKSHLGNEWQSIPITYVEQKELRGTGDALLTAKPLLNDKFLVVNGDDIYAKADLTAMLDYQYSLLCWDTGTPYQFGLRLNPESHFTGFDPNSSLTNCGVYVLDEKFFEYPLATVEVHGKKEYSLPHTLVLLAEQQPVHVIKASSWLPVGTPEQLEIAKERTVN